MVSVIIPAFNEESTIGQKVAEVVGHPLVREVIVVDDGSADTTAALEAGVAAASGDVLLFLDADVTGYDHATLTRIIEPVLSGRYEMFVGIRARRTYWLNRALHFFPIIGGERALTRALWESVPAEHKQGFQIEIAMNYCAKQAGKGMGFVLIAGTTHHIKERKYGVLVGLARRAGMIRDVVAISFRLYIAGYFARLGNKMRSIVRAG